MDVSLRLSPDGRINAGVEMGKPYRYPSAGVEIAYEGIGRTDCITINCTGGQVEAIVRDLLVDFIDKAEPERVRLLLDDAARQFEAAQAEIATRAAKP